MGFYHVILKRFEVAVPGLPAAARWTCVDNWSVGYLREDGYQVMEDDSSAPAATARSGPSCGPHATPAALAMCVSDVLGSGPELVLGRSSGMGGAER